MESRKAGSSVLLLTTALLFGSAFASAQTLQELKNPADDEGLSAGGSAALFGAYTGPGNNNPQPGYHDNGRGGNTFVNDPCLDPPPPNRRRTVQSEDEIATFGKYMVIGYNDSYGFYDNTQGLSGFSYSVNGGNTWVDGAGLPPLLPAPGLPPDAAHDRYFGDPVVVVDKSARTFGSATQAAGEFYYASIYQLPGGTTSLSVNRGRFQTAPPQTPESVADTRCLKDPTQQGVPNTQTLPTERIIWEPPVVAVPVINPGDFLDKEWLYANQANGELYLTYTRFGFDGSTPLELVRSTDGGRTWTPPTIIVPNLNDTFITATQPAVTSTGRVIVVFYSRQFSAGGFGPESDDRIDYAYSDDDGATFSPIQTIQHVNPQGEPLGYNRGRTSILNTPYINTYPHGTDVYVSYFSGKSPLGTPLPYAKAADIYVASSHDNATTFVPVKVNDDAGVTSHVFPSTQVNKTGDVYAGWSDRRFDPTNVLTDVFANVSHDGGATWGHDKLQTDVATSWFARADARPNFGDYNSSELLNDNQFLLVWSDGRFPPPATAPAIGPTPDTIFTIANGLGVGSGGNH